MFDGFSTRTIETNKTRIYARTGGSRPPLLFLHGFPKRISCGATSRRFLHANLPWCVRIRAGMAAMTVPHRLTTMLLTQSARWLRIWWA